MKAPPNGVQNPVLAAILLFACAPVLANSGASGSGVDTQPQILAPFYTGAEYQPPAVGSYRLPPLGEAADGDVLTDQGRPARLHELMDDKIVLLSFVYSSCTDINGCPLSTAVMFSIKNRIADDPSLRGRLRMISLSFDPEYDTPEVMEIYGSSLSGDDWRFLTTASRDKLEPILRSYGQTLIRDNDGAGNPLPSYSHILRVFLIDPEKQIRNIYSVSFLHPEVIINDVKTVLASVDSTRPAPPQETAAHAAPRLSRPGDDKSGYDSENYRTQSQAIELRGGRQTDLMRFVVQPPLGLPAVPIPADNPVTPSKIGLGRKLFFDRRLSLNDTFSCAMCHVPEQGFTSNELAMAVGLEGRSVRRNSPTIYNVSYARRLFHDGREENLEQQVWGPLLARNEMANPSIGFLLAKIRGMPDYDGLFQEAFAGRGPTMQTLGMALASYQRTLNSANSPFDRWRFGGDDSALGAGAERGFALFTGSAGCSACHTLEKDHALFTDHRMHNTGTGYRESMGIRPATKRVTLAPGVFVDVDMDLIDSVSAKPPPDLGLYEITQNPDDRWKYKTPSLRNVALSAPYMHNGSLSTLEDVVRFYDRGGVSNALRDPLIRTLNLSDQDVSDLVAFLQSLTGDNVDTLVSDAFAAPVGDITTADPNWAHDNRLEF